MSDTTVVPQIEALDEEQFHAAMMIAISTQVSNHGRAKVAKAMDGLSLKQLENIGKGAFPTVHRLYNLRALDPEALDPIDRKYGVRSVPRDAVCTSDPVSSKLANLLSRTIDMERPDSDGGQTATLREVLDLDEKTLRDCACKLTAWVELIDAYRAGEAPKLRVAS